MVHARSKFKHDKDNDPVLVPQIMSMFHDLYEIEREAREKNISNDEIKALRLLNATDILTDMKAWLDDKLLTVPPKSG